MEHDKIKTRDVTLLVGAEGVSEIKDEPWAREATEEETKTWRDELEKPYKSAISGDLISGRKDVDQLYLDSMGRPYFLCTILKSAPIDVWLKASSHLRTIRVTP